MKLKEFVKNLNKLMEENPKAKNFTVVSAIDDEGNGFNEVIFKPSLGVWNPVDKAWSSLYDEYDKKIPAKDCNSICIN